MPAKAKRQTYNDVMKHMRLAREVLESLGGSPGDTDKLILDHIGQGRLLASHQRRRYADR